MKFSKYDPAKPITDADYAAYLKSSRWLEAQARFRASKRSQGCLVCGDLNVTLFHRTRDRVGRERPADLLPLCSEHEGELYRLRGRRSKRSATAKQLAYIESLGAKVDSAEMTPRQAVGVISVAARLSDSERRS
jgi:hypothetical protein